MLCEAEAADSEAAGLAAFRVMATVTATAQRPGQVTLTVCAGYNSSRAKETNAETASVARTQPNSAATLSHVARSRPSVVA